MRTAAAVCLLVLAAGCSAGGSPPDTSPAAPASPPSPRDGATAAPLPVPRSEVAGAVWGERLVVAGGFLRDGRTSGQVDAWTPASGWQGLPDLPEPRNHPGLAVLDDRLYLVGGYGEDGAASSAVWSLGEDDGTWRTEPALPEPRAAAGVASVQDRLVITGGAADGRQLDSTAVLQDGRWEAGPALAEAREHLGAAVLDGRIYAVAGRAVNVDGDPGVVNLAVVESFAPGDSAWRTEPPLPAPRGGNAATAVAGQVCTAGGEDPERTEPVVLCLRDGRWREVGRLSEPRHGLAVVALAGRLHVVAGGPRPGLTVSGAHEVLDVG